MSELVTGVTKASKGKRGLHIKPKSPLVRDNIVSFLPLMVRRKVSNKNGHKSFCHEFECHHGNDTDNDNVAASVTRLLMNWNNGTNKGHEEKNEEKNKRKERSSFGVQNSFSDQSDIENSDMEDSSMDENPSPRPKQGHILRDGHHCHWIEVNATSRGDKSQGLQLEEEVGLVIKHAETEPSGAETHHEDWDQTESSGTETSQKRQKSARSNGTKKQAERDAHENIHCGQLSDSSDGSMSGLLQCGLGYKEPYFN